MDRGRWQPLDPDSLVAAPCLIEQTLCQPSQEQPQLAKDVDYAKSVLEAWKEEEDFSWQAIWKPIVYQDESNTTLYGYCIRKDDVKDNGGSEKDVPGIIFFHTGAGPHDIFLLFKAVSLVNKMDKNCVIFIADILGDESGWAWDEDRTKYNIARENVLAVDNSNSETTGVVFRPLLQQRIQAALEYLTVNESVNRFAAMGWCLGGHPILEMSRMVSIRSKLQALVTFHGVFDGLPAPKEDMSPTDDGGGSSSIHPLDVLICHGTDDPFVSTNLLENALATFQAHRCRTSLLQLPAKHGFSNPAQDYNPNPAFQYNAEAATKSWKQAINHLKKNL
jgi:dienelactone hydrolase